MTNVNVIPTLENFDRDLTYRYTDPALVSQFKRGLFQRDTKKSNVESILKAYLSGFDVPEIIVNRRTMNVLDGGNRTEAWFRAIEVKPDCELKVKYRDVQEGIAELDEFIALNSGLPVRSNHLVEASATYKKPNASKYVEFAETHGRLTATGKVKKTPKTQNVDTLLFGSKMPNYLKSHYDYPEITDDDLKLADKVVKDVDQALSVFKTNLIGSRERDLIQGWRSVRRNNPETCKVIDRVGIPAFATLLEVNFTTKYGASNITPGQWIDLINDTAKQMQK